MEVTGKLMARANRSGGSKKTVADAVSRIETECVIVGAGRPLDRREQVSRLLFGTLCDALAPVSAASPLAISFNMQEFDPVLNLKKNNLHEYVRRRAGED